MAFDQKAYRKIWDAANREKVKLYSVRYRMRQKGEDFAPETIAQMQAEREAKKAQSKEREKERKKRYREKTKEQRNARYRERYHSDPEFRRKEIDKRIAALGYRTAAARAERAAIKDAKQRAKLAAKEQAKEDRLRHNREEAAKKRKLENAKRHQQALEKAASIPPKPAKKTMNVRKPGRLVALAGWHGW